MSAYAQEASLSDLLECRAITADEMRLACFDKALKKLELADEKQLSPSEHSGQAAFSNPSAPRATLPQKRTDDDFGKLPERNFRKQANTTLTTTVRTIHVNKLGKYVFTLNNGQIWRQISADNATLRFSKKGSGKTATLKRRSFGSHTLSLEGSKRSVRVKRVK